MRLVRFGYNFSDGELSNGEIWEGLELGNKPNKDSRIMNEELQTIQKYSTKI